MIPNVSFYKNPVMNAHTDIAHMMPHQLLDYSLTLAKL
jgi:hypothetical protein